jgi:hypothetical protein
MRGLCTHGALLLLIGLCDLRAELGDVTLRVFILLDCVERVVACRLAMSQLCVFFSFIGLRVDRVPPLDWALFSCVF